MGIRDRNIIQDTRGQKTAQFISGASNLFAKGQQAAAARREKEQNQSQREIGSVFGSLGTQGHR